MSWYELHLDPDDNNTFLVTSPDFPEVTTYGGGIKDSLKFGRDAIEEAIAARIAAGEEIPAPDQDGEGMKYSVQMSMLVVLKAGLYMCCKSKHVSRAELARRLEWHREQVDRLFRLEHNSRVDQMESAFKAIGINLSNPVPYFSDRAA